jgi:hypothetical protein
MTESQRSSEASSLAELVAQRLAALGDKSGPMSLRAAVERSRGRLSLENLRRMARGEHQGNFADRTAEGLALALDVPVAEVYRVAGLPQPSGRWEWDAKYDRLDLKHRRIVEDVADGFLDAYEQGRRQALS